MRFLTEVNVTLRIQCTLHYIYYRNVDKHTQYRNVHLKVDAVIPVTEPLDA